MTQPNKPESARELAEMVRTQSHMLQKGIPIDWIKFLCGAEALCDLVERQAAEIERYRKEEERINDLVRGSLKERGE